MFHPRVVIIGAGQAGLAVSKHLTDADVDHVLLERGRTAEHWSSQRWDSLRLLTPNWMTRLPGFAYRGDDPDGYMSAPQVARQLADGVAQGHVVAVEQITRVYGGGAQPDSTTPSPGSIARGRHAQHEQNLG